MIDANINITETQISGRECNDRATTAAIEHYDFRYRYSNVSKQDNKFLCVWTRRLSHKMIQTIRIVENDPTQIPYFTSTKFLGKIVN